MALETFSDRLRMLRASSKWTAQSLSDRTGLPKRTIESYLLKENAPTPGIDALKKLSDGLGVSIDWLVGGEEQQARRVAGLTQYCAEDASMKTLAALYEAIERKTPLPDKEYLAIEIGVNAGLHARSIVAEGVSDRLIAAVSKMERIEKLNVIREHAKALRSRIRDLEEAGFSVPDDSGEGVKGEGH